MSPYYDLQNDMHATREYLKERKYAMEYAYKAAQGWYAPLNKLVLEMAVLMLIQHIILPDESLVVSLASTHTITDKMFMMSGALNIVNGTALWNPRRMSG